MGNSPSSNAEEVEDVYGSVYHSALDFSEIARTNEQRDALFSSHPYESTLTPNPRGDVGMDGWRPGSSQRGFNSRRGSSELLGKSNAENLPLTDSTNRSPFKVNDAIALLEELKKTATPEELAALQKALYMGGHESKNNQPTTSGQEEGVDKNRPAPHRRRSIFGTKTDTRISPPNLLKKTPPSKNSTRNKNQHQTWSPEMFGESPLARLASLNGGEIDRSATPSDLDRSYLGTHRIGSLHVINGAASPAPSIRGGAEPKKSNGVLLKDDDYFTASESGRGSPTKPRYDRGNVTSADSLRDRQRTPTEEYQVDQAKYTPNIQVSNASDQSSISSRKPLGPRNQTLIRRTTNESFVSLEEPSEPSQPGRNMYQHEATSNPFQLETLHPEETDLNRSSTEKSMSSTASAIGRPSTRQQMYQTEATSNPFLPMDGSTEMEDDATVGANEYEFTVSRTVEHSEPINDTDSVYSEHPIAIDRQKSLRRWQPSPMISEPDSVYSERPGQDLSRNQKTDVYGRYAAYYETYGPSNTGYQDQHWPMEMGYHAPATRPQYEHPDQNPMMSTRPKLKVDSGYHSESSLRTINENPSFAKLPSTDKANHHEMLRPALNERAKTAPQVPDNTQLFYSGRTPSPAKSPIKLDGTRNSQSSPYASPNKSTSSLEVVQTPQTPGSSSVPTTPKSTPVRPGPKKLQKKRRKSEHQLQPAVTSLPVPNANQRSFSGVPLVPQEMVFRHAERIIQNPGMDHLEHTFKSVSHANDKDSVREDVFNVEIKFPSPNPSPEPTLPTTRGRKSRRASYGPQQSTQSRFRSLSGNHGRKEDDATVGVADFGTVTASLGSNPYDIATGPAPYSRRRAPKANPSTHPHQISSMRPRSKSAVGMDERTASQFALRKSRDRLANFEDHRKQWGDAMYSIPSDSMEVLPPRSRRRQTMYSEQSRVPNAKPSVRPRSFHEGFAADEYVDDQFSTLGHLGHNYQAHSGWEYEDDYKVLRESQGNSRPNTNVSRGQDYSSAVEDLDAGWERHAKAWRMRRKSIGENLGREEPEWRTREAPKPETSRYHRSNESKKPANPATMKPLPPSPNRSSEAIQGPPRQPSPSILARAAIFDRPKFSSPPPEVDSSRTHEFQIDTSAKSLPVSPSKSPDPQKKPRKSNLRKPQGRPQTPHIRSESDDTFTTASEVPLPHQTGPAGNWGLVDIPALMRQVS